MPAPKHSKAAIKAAPAPKREEFKTAKAYAEACRLVSEARVAFDKPKPVGRPTLYRDFYPEQARKLCLLGATDVELAGFFDVDEATVHRWKLEYPQFCESIKEGKEIADATVASKLYHRATGYSHTSVKIFANPNTGVEQIVPYEEHYPPETTACIFWLKNRQKEKWRDKQEIDQTVDMRVSMTGAERDARIAELLAKKPG